MPRKEARTLEFGTLDLERLLQLVLLALDKDAGVEIDSQ